MYGTLGSNLAIGISLIMRDRFTGQATTAGAALSKLEMQALNAARAQMTMQRNINAIGAGVGLAALRGMAGWVKVGSEFGYTMKYVETLTRDKGGPTTMDTLIQKTKDLGAQTMFTSQEIADGVKYMAMAGQSTTEIYNNLGAAVALAGATMSRIEGKGGSADIMTNIMKGFNIEATEKNSMRVADILTAAVTGANTDLHDLHEGMKYAVSTASTLGGSIEEVAAALMMLGNAGIQGSMAGVALENTYRYIARAAAEGKENRQGKALAALGLHPNDIKDSNGQLLSLAGILELIGTRFDQMAETDRTKGLSTVFGYNVMADLVNVRGNRAALKLAQNMKDYRTFIDDLTYNSDGRAVTNMADMMDTLEGSTIQLTSAWDNFKIAFTEGVEPVLRPLIKVITEGVVILTKFMQTPLGKYLSKFTLGYIALRTAIMGYRAIVLTLRLTHLGMAKVFGTSASAVVGGYGSMTAAAKRYAAAATAAATAAGTGAIHTGGVLGRNKAGRYYRTQAGRTGKAGTFVSNAAAARYQSMYPGGNAVGNKGMSWGKLGRFAKGGAVPAAVIGGMVATMGAESTRDETTGQLSNMGIALDATGNTLAWAGTGAMVGSLFGPVGTVVGAVVGGVSGLAYSLYNNLRDVEDIVNEANDHLKQISPKDDFDIEAWKKKVQIMEVLGDGPTIVYGKGYNDNLVDMTPTTQRGAAQWLVDKGKDPEPTQVIINIDGKKAMDKIVKDRQRELLINLATF